MLVHWEFYDPSNSETYTFLVNPNEGGTPSRRKNVTSRPTLAPKGQMLYFEGSDEPLKFSWSGVLLEESQLLMYQEWYDNRHQVQLTDDLGRSFYLYITSFNPQRQRAAHHQFKCSYTVEATLLDWS